MLRYLPVPALLLLAFAPGLQAAGPRVPPGFSVTQFAGPELAPDIYCLTIGPKGQVVVSGRGYVRRLAAEGDGLATGALDFAGAPKDGAMGLFWDADDSLYAIGGGGLWVWGDAGGAGRTKPPRRIFEIKTGGEHDAHAVLRGPDGWLYLLCGNHAGVAARHATLPTSPVKNPVAGCVLRFAPGGTGCEIVAHGLRNAYGMDFNPDGELFTFDSDNERCVGLPWYEFTRCYHVVEGGFHGWRSPQLSDTWRLPPHLPDVVPPVCTLGRGSPTGVTCYRHAQFPARYRGGLFLSDWTFGRIWFVALARQGSSYTGTPEVFLQASGEDALAPTGSAVHPATGDLYFSVGGRGTRGAVYRVRHEAGARALDPAEAKRHQVAPRSLDWAPGRDREILGGATGSDLPSLRRSLAAVRRFRDRFSADQVRQVVAEATTAPPDRLVTLALADLLRDLPADQRERLRGTGRPSLAFDLVAPSLLPRPEKVADRLAWVRVSQLALGDLTAKEARGTTWEGYTPRRPVPVPADWLRSLTDAYPSGDANLDRELTRTLALVEAPDPALPARLAAALTTTSDPLEDLHNLLVLARWPARRSAAVTAATTSALLSLDRKLTAAGHTRDRHWPLRVAELHRRLAERDPGLDAALVTHADFGRPDHALFACAPGFDRPAAAARVLKRAESDREFAWTADAVGLVADLPGGRGAAALRPLWGEAGLDDVILPALARAPLPEDRDKLLAGLASPQPGLVRTALAGLERLPPAKDEPARAEGLALLRARLTLAADKAEAKLAGTLEARLARVTGQKLVGPEAWLAWGVRAYPESAARLADPDGVDVAAWDRRLAKIDWAAGDATRGRAVFVKASCAACHSGSQALGPDLAGVSGRFPRADLLTAIVRPSKDVSPRYRTTAVTTDTGKTYQGLIVYEAADGLILQTGPGQTVRVEGARVNGKQPTATSLMPAGLLDRLADADIADLLAHLRTLR